jgi:hypothetical protein
MELSLTTPALLFPAISLLLLAYTNRFLALAQLIRSLHGRHQETPSDVTQRQIANLALRLELIRWMQMFGVLGFVLCTVSMAGLYYMQRTLAELCFGASLATMVISLLISLWEVSISVGALTIELEHMKGSRNPNTLSKRQ